MKKPTPIDWARLAAYIDSEGSIFIRIVSSKRPWHELRLSINNTDPRLIVWCKEVCGVGCIQQLRPQKENRRPCFEWMVSGQVASEVLTKCLPHFLLKREQAELGIAFQKTKTWRGYRGVPAHIIAVRHEMLTEMHRLKHVQHPLPPNLIH